MGNSNSEVRRAPAEPKLRHEFVSMMFAVTIGEVGLQAAALIRAGNWVRLLPAWGHLFLATAVIATSWVGWSLSQAPAARKDVNGVFERGFVILLLDVILVIVYFILVRTVNFEGASARVDPASTVARWVFFIFILYLVWDFLTKDFSWGILPTGICVVLAWLIGRLVRAADQPHYLTADFALLCLVFFFRAGKELMSKWLSVEGRHTGLTREIRRPAIAATVCLLGILIGIIWTICSWPVPR
jgi:hypothetical protein